MLLILINVLVIIVVGAILFYLIDRFVRDGRLGNLVVLICLAASCSGFYRYLDSDFRNAWREADNKKAQRGC
jgi:F0F1-type ATP synthase assembly protein I